MSTPPSASRISEMVASNGVSEPVVASGGWPEDGAFDGPSAAFGVCGAGSGACPVLPAESTAPAAGASVNGPGYGSAGLLLAEEMTQGLRTAATKASGFSTRRSIASTRLAETS